MMAAACRGIAFGSLVLARQLSILDLDFPAGRFVLPAA
jgi:hypothetical protein